MLFERLSVAVFVVLALAVMRANSTDHHSADELDKAFWRLYKYLNETVGQEGSQQDYLKAAKNIGWKLERGNYLSRAAKIYVHLNEFETCNKEAIDNMLYVIQGRPNGVPGHKVRKCRRGGCYTVDKTFLDRLLEASLLRASDKCKSFLERWYRESEPQMDSETKEILHKLMTRQYIEEARLTSIGFGQVFAKKSLSDASLREKLLQMEDKQLFKFYTKYLDDNLLKPCKKFLAKMEPVLKRGHRFYPYYHDLIDEPSRYFADDIARYERCELFLRDPQDWSDIKSIQAVEYVQKSKKRSYQI